MSSLNHAQVHEATATYVCNYLLYELGLMVEENLGLGYTYLPVWRECDNDMVHLNNIASKAQGYDKYHTQGDM